MYLDQLKKILPLPSPPNNEAIDWKGVEKEHSIHFPYDYQQLLHTYGCGSIDDFFWILTPFHEDKNVNVFSQLATMKYSYNYVKKNLPLEFDYQFFPSDTGLFPWCMTENGDELYWMKHGSTYKIVIFEARYAAKYEYEMCILEFLYKLLNQEIQCDAFPSSLWEQSHYFKYSL